LDNGCELPIKAALRSARNEYAQLRCRRGCRKRSVRITREAQAVFCRRRHQPRRPPHANSRPETPAPAMGPGGRVVGNTLALVGGRLDTSPALDPKECESSADECKHPSAEAKQPEQGKAPCRGIGCARATVGGASRTLAAWRRNQAARFEINGSRWDFGGLGNGPNLLLCSLAASRSARCSKNAAPLSRSIGNQDRIVARVRRGGHIRPGLAVFRPRCHSCHCRGQRCGRCRGNHQIVPLFRT
jgi:hypothetical protein